MTIGCVALLLIVASAAAVTDQRDVSQLHLSAVDQLIQKSYEAMQRYRSGDLRGALALLGAMTKSEQEKAVNGIRGQIERIAAGGPRKKEEVVSWTPALLRALAALHMEAAIAARSSRARDADETADDHIAIATAAFGAAAAVTGEEDAFAARWILAQGLDVLAEGNFADAYGILTPYCHEKQTYAALLVTCATIHETFASLPADQLGNLADGRRRREAVLDWGYDMRELGSARLERGYQLTVARKYLDRAVTLDDSSTEALLRLANVRMQQKEDGPAAEILEKLIARRSLDQRAQYLTHLFLARIRDRQKRFDAAMVLLINAGTHQSSLVARAHNAQRRGDAREAAALVDRATRLGSDDPWWSYRFGQYWLVEALFKELREEARK